METGLLLIDTDVLVDYSRGIEKTKEILKIWNLTSYLQSVLLPSLNWWLVVKTRPI